MTTVVLLKFFHYVSLFLAGGLGVANALLFKNHQKAESASGSTSSKDDDDACSAGFIFPSYLVGYRNTAHF